MLLRFSHHIFPLNYNCLAIFVLYSLLMQMFKLSTNDFSKIFDAIPRKSGILVPE